MTNSDKLAAVSVRFESRRAWQLRLVRLAIAVLGGALLVILFASSTRVIDWIEPRLAWLGAARLFEVLRGIDLQAGIIGLVKNTDRKPLEDWLKGCFEAWPWTMTFLIGTGLTWSKGAEAAKWTHGLAFERFDKRVLTRIGKPKAFDPLRGTVRSKHDKHQDIPLPFVAAGNSPRGLGFKHLLAFVRAETCREGRIPFSKLTSPFAYTLILGRTGAGKSRLVVQIARRLALRGDHSHSGHDRPSAASWWRVQVWGQTCREDRDPWDAGWLRPGVQKLSRGGRRYQPWVDELNAASAGPWLALLANWRPARPTVLILDDPRDADAAAIVNLLNAQAKNYRHPVRLIIVNQTMPEILSRSGALLPAAQPLLLDDGFQFTDADLREVLRSPGIVRHLPLTMEARRAAFEKLIQITGREPLLIEIAVNLVIAGEPVEGFTRDRLITERVERVFAALEAAGVTQDEQRALALATLAAGGGAADKRAACKAAEIGEISAQRLSHIFPTESVDLTNLIPPIRPEPIGDAFAESVFALLSDGLAAQMVDASWRLNADATLKVALRLAAEPDLALLNEAQPLHTTKLARELARAPSAELKLDRTLIAKAFAEKALVLPLQTFPEDPAGLRARTLRNPALAQIAAASPPEALALVEELMLMAEKVEPGRPFMARVWLALLAAALTQAGPQTDGLERVKILLTRLHAVWPRHLTTWGFYLHDFEPVGLGLRRLLGDDASSWSVACDIRSHALALLQYSEIAAFYPLTDAIVREAQTPMMPALDPMTLEQWADAAVISRNGDVPERKQNFARLVQKAAADAPLNEHRALQTARASASVIWNFPNLGLSEQQEFEKLRILLETFPVHIDMRRYCAFAWRYLAYAHRDDPKACREAVDKVDDIAKPFPNDRDHQFERAVAWRILAYAHRDDPTACREAVDKVDDITKPFPNDRDHQCERAVAWRYLAYAHQDDPTACREAVDKVDDIAKPFPSDRGHQLERAQAWRTLAYAHRDDPTACRKAVYRVDDIAKPFPNDPDYQFDRAVAWCCLAHAHQNNSTALNEIVIMIEAIAEQSPAHEGIQSELAEARSLGNKLLR